MNGRNASRFFRFCVVGSVGFLVDGGSLTILVALGVGPYTARLISFPLAVTVTWLFNRKWTFADGATTRPKREYTVYFVVQITGALINLGVYAALLSHWEVLKAIVLVPFAVASATALIFNYVGMQWFVFTQRTSDGGGKKVGCCAPAGCTLNRSEK